MSTIKSDNLTTKSDNTDLSITAHGSGKVDIETGFKVSGTLGVPIADLRTSSGSASSSTFLRGDGTWNTPSGGKVLQVVTAATSTEATSTSTTYADTNLTADITPANSSNKVLVLVSQSITSSGNRAGAAIRILRGTTEIEEYSQISNVENQMAQHFIQHLDSPSSTSSTTYHTEVKRIDQSGTVVAQRNDASGNATSTITLIEIGA